MSDIVGIIVLVIVAFVIVGICAYDTLSRLREYKRTMTHERIWRTQLLMILRENTVYQKSISDYLGTMCCVFERMEEFEDLDAYDEKGVELL